MGHGTELYAATGILVKDHLVPGSVLLMIHLTRKDLQGDGKAFLEAMKGVKYKLHKVPFYPSIGVAQIL